MLIVSKTIRVTRWQALAERYINISKVFKHIQKELIKTFCCYISKLKICTNQILKLVSLQVPLPPCGAGPIGEGPGVSMLNIFQPTRITLINLAQSAVQTCANDLSKRPIESSIYWHIDSHWFILIHDNLYTIIHGSWTSSCIVTISYVALKSLLSWSPLALRNLLNFQMKCWRGRPENSRHVTQTATTAVLRLPFFWKFHLHHHFHEFTVNWCELP